ncbi:GrpB family protein [Nostoc commune]|uniref:GrpB family protein n=1 Tax=Nostoc commune TaxID=1178 RepID=UPI00350E5002
MAKRSLSCEEYNFILVTEQVLVYGELKRQLAQRFRYDVDSYCDAKTQFVEGILKTCTSR